ncbi:MAG: hypothetical protein ACLR9S_00185 [Lachnospiraceae bacterium]
MAGQLNVNFHQTFKPERQYVGSVLDVANMTEPMSVKDISSLTGIPNGKSSGKVEPHIFYAKFMGLIESEKKDGLIWLKKTALGEIVSMEDPGLQEELTILLCHAMMLRDNNGADVWSAVFKKILPLYRNGIKRDILLIELEKLFDGKVNKKNFAPFTGSYEDMFSELNLLLMDKDSIKVNSLPYNKEFIYLYAYILFEYWSELFPNQDEISEVQFKELNFGKAFGWNEQDEYEVLEHLADSGLIRMNKQLVPYTILQLADKDSVIERLYSELC